MLARETFSFKDVYQRSDFNVDYVYEVELIVIKDLEREIVYKKDKSKSIISLRISKKGYIKFFTNENIDELDIDNKFNTVPEKSNKPLNKVLKIYDDNDYKYIETIVFKYLDKVLLK